MTFELAGLLIVAMYIFLQPASYVVFLTTLVGTKNKMFQNFKVVLQLSYNRLKPQFVV